MVSSCEFLHKMKRPGQSGIARKGKKRTCSRWLTLGAFFIWFSPGTCSRVMAVSYLQEGFNYAPGILGTNAPWINPTNLISVTNGGLAYPFLMDFSPPA